MYVTALEACYTLILKVLNGLAVWRKLYNFTIKTITPTLCLSPKRPIKSMNKIGVLVFILMMAVGAQDVSGKIQFFTTDHDITSSLINVIYQDRKGMVWVGTEDGLNRYDGAKFTQYRNIPGDTTSLAHNYVNMVFEDSKGRLFVGTYTGLQLYDPTADAFSGPARKENGDLFNTSITRMYESAPDSLWVVRNSRAKIVKADKNGIVVRPIRGDNQLLDDADGRLHDVAGFTWFHNRNGLYRVNKDNEVVSHHPEINDPIGVYTAVSRDGTLYATTYTGGLYKYDIIADRFVKVPDPSGQSLMVRSLYSSDSDPELYLATDGHGLKRFDPESEKFTTVLLSDGTLDDYNQKVHSVLKDRGGNLWVSLFQKGIVMVPSRQDSFKYIGHKSRANNIIGENCVVALARDSRDGVLWVGLDNGGLYEVDLKTMTSKQYSGDVPWVVSGLFFDSNDNLWVGSYAGGCGLFDTKSKTFRRVALREEDGGDDISVYGFTEDEFGNIWIATLGNGLFIYNPQSGQVTSGEKYTPNKWFTSALYSKRSKSLYLGAYDGLLKLDDINSKGVSEKLFGGNIVHAVMESADGSIWLATSGGLMQYNPSDGSASVYTIEDGLPVNTVYGIEEDDQGILWVSTSRGLSQFNRKKREFTNFFVDDGLQGNEFYKNASCRDSQGTIYFGGTDGITYFNPADIVNPGRKWTVRLTDIYLHGSPVKGDALSGGRKILDGPIYDVDRIYLDYTDNSFSIEFATEEFGDSESMVYQYSIDGDKWVTLSHGQNMVNFSDLNSGNHKLKVRVRDNDVISDEKELTIAIGSPWYATWWAYLIYVVLFLALSAFVLYEAMRRRRRMRADMERRQAEQINEAKFQFFINISHEIRTPMTLVMSPLKKLMESDDSPERQQSYKLIQRNAKRVLRLVNELMDIRKIDKKRLKLTFSETLMSPFLEDLYDTFRNAAVAKDIDLTFEHQGCDDLKVWIDRANFDKIIMNLLSNAIKYTPSGGRVTMSMSTGTDMSESGSMHRYMEISVTDTGIGVPDEEKVHIFERFYQVAGNTAGGTGIGLHLTYSLVKLHHGTIDVSDNPEGKGTRFTVRIPLGAEHLKDEELSGMNASSHSEDEINRLKNIGLAPLESDDQVGGASSTQRQPYGKETVLIVEDDEDIRRYLCDELSARYKTVVCDNGKSAYEQILKKAPDIVVSDVMMPLMDGLELTSKIKGNINLNHIPVVLLTAKTREEDNIRGLEAGADAYIAKPFGIDMLVSTISALLRKHRQLKNTFSGQQNHDDKVTDIQMTSYDEKLMAKVMKVIDENISNPDITVEMLASEVGLSRVHLHRKLKELTNQAPREFIRNTRLRVAAKMLVESRLSVADVAMALGFKNANNFATAFKSLYGVSPTEYAERNQA